MSLLSRTLAGLAGVAVVAGAAAAWGHVRWSRLTDERVARLQAARVPIVPARVDLSGLEALPAPVGRYLRKVLADGAPRASAVRIVHRGTFDVTGRGDDWKPFTSRQWVSTARPGFVWDARIAMAPGVAVRVHDAYVAGEGILQASVLGLVDVAHLRGGDEMARGELMRWLAETAWYPSALLPGAGVSWEAVDDRSARATVADGPVRVTVTVRFGEDDLIAGVHADARGRAVGDRIEQAPWEGRFGDYARIAGTLVPTSGEVAWLLPGGRLPYWRGMVESIEPEFAR